MRRGSSNGFRWVGLLLAGCVTVSCTGSVSDMAPATGQGPGAGAGGAGGPAVPGGSQTGGTAGPMTPGPEGPRGPIGNEAPVACDSNTRGTGARRIWRLDATQYTNTVAALLGGPGVVATRDSTLGKGVATPFGTKFPGDQFSTTAASYGITDADFGTVMKGASDIASRMVNLLKADPAGCLGKGAFAECAGKVLADRGAAMFRRPLTSDELAVYRDQAVKIAGALGEAEALTTVLEGMALSPHFLFRTEIGDGTRSSSGGVRLTPHEVASAISYSLTDWPPDAELLKAAQANQLGTPEQLKPHVVRLLGEMGNQTKVLRFFDELLELEEIGKVFKEPKQYPYHSSAALLEDIRALLKDVLTTNGKSQFLETLLSTRTAIVRGKTLGSYGLPPDPTIDNGPTKKVTLPERERAGILTHPAVLVALGDNDDRHPVELGHYVREQILCQDVPAIPAGLTPMLPEGNLTWKERLAITRKPGEVCWTCHQQMDPLGLAFQIYDHTGRYRMIEAGKPIDAADVLTGAGTADGPFKDAVELSLKLSKSNVAEQCLVRQSFRYWLGRIEERFDGCLLTDAHEAYRKQGSYVDMLTALFASHTFLHRN